MLNTIFKCILYDFTQPGVPAFTLPQKVEGLEVIRDRAKELNVSSIMISPDSSSYTGTIWGSLFCVYVCMYIQMDEQTDIST